LSQGSLPTTVRVTTPATGCAANGPKRSVRGGSRAGRHPRLPRHMRINLT
jgi:hypothetical protein